MPHTAVNYLNYFRWSAYLLPAPRECIWLPSKPNLWLLLLLLLLMTERIESVPIPFANVIKCFGFDRWMVFVYTIFKFEIYFGLYKEFVFVVFCIINPICEGYVPLSRRGHYLFGQRNNVYAHIDHIFVFINCNQLHSLMLTPAGNISAYWLSTVFLKGSASNNIYCNGKYSKHSSINLQCRCVAMDKLVDSTLN